MLRTLTRSLAAVLLPAVVLAACGNDDDDAATDVGDAEVGVTAVDYGYEGLLASVPAGTRRPGGGDGMPSRWRALLRACLLMLAPTLAGTVRRCRGGTLAALRRWQPS